MLIINADDLGRNTAATDTALACYEKKRITSASAMVFMADSERAAKLASAAGIDVGLHINFSEQFSAEKLPQRLYEEQEEICRFLTKSKYSLLLYNPWLSGKLRFVFDTQLSEFMRLYGRPPSHFDGHQHYHLATNMLLQELLPAGAKVRRSFSFRPGEKGMINRCYRRMVDRYLSGRYRLTDYFYSFSNHLTTERLTRVLDLAENANVELMVHPERADEYRFLMSDEFAGVISRVRLGAYQDL